MKITMFLAFLAFTSAACTSQEKVSTKTFDDIALVNGIEFVNKKFNQPRFSCGFLLKHNNDTFAVTAKHLLKIIKTDEMKTLSISNQVEKWQLYPLTKPSEVVVTDKLLNANPGELLEEKSTYNEDWLVFSLKENRSNTKPLQFRSTPLLPGEKLYVVGWTRKMESGEQRVYEFEYHKTVGNRILLKEILVPEQFGGLSGAPVVDGAGYVVALVSNSTADPETNKKYFSPCTLTSLVGLLDKMAPVSQL
ncbi:hypothetical protein EXU57_00720 [Segetibacter sp. 3557_3]|uniref:trypsin-like serine protease n=1 Tax=Segetibacter sp. 3557_3 TaxID=2547429 RepID=UPI00105841A6|nr:trypsin-like serine protease [Segetibacter sp. 3557_3]TDH28633.1 hypothetical protein EXU57_00720 [Segetibacter sp. 3557_3]